MARMTASASSDPLDPLPFRAGDAARAQAAMHEHISRSRDRLMLAFE